MARTLRARPYREQQTQHHRHPRYRHRVIAHDARWTVPPAPLWRRHVGTTIVETGLNLAMGGSSSFADMPSLAKGVIWLFLATIAEVTPVVSPPRFVAPLLFFSFHCVVGVYFLGSKW